MWEGESGCKCIKIPMARMAPSLAMIASPLGSMERLHRHMATVFATCHDRTYRKTGGRGEGEEGEGVLVSDRCE